MHQFVFSLIAALRDWRIDPAAAGLSGVKVRGAAMIELGGAALAHIVGGDVFEPNAGPRGGWIASTIRAI
jgi:hypothetical protein